jgi:hypothetical protein
MQWLFETTWDAGPGDSFRRTMNLNDEYVIGHAFQC